MPGFLEDYGVEQARREALVKRIVLAAVLAAAAGGVLYYQFRNFREERQVKRFFELLERKEYPAAYRLWGCTEEAPCRDYQFARFLEDWGPQGLHADIGAAKTTKTRSCRDGIIQTLTFAPDDEVWIWVDRKSRTLAYAPWPVCDPQLPASTFQPE